MLLMLTLVVLISKLNKEFLEKFGVKKLITSAYHPQTNGLCERVNATVKVIYYFDICM